MRKNGLLNALRSENLILAGKIFGIFLITAGLSLGNSVVLTDQSGITQSGRPVTISRVFKQGDITQFPRPSVSGSSLPAWQSNVMNRWPDGSVKHALITFNQTVPANGSVTVLFVNDPNPCHLGNQASCDAAAPNQSQILSFNSSAWGAEISVVENSMTLSASARTMIAAGAWRFWVKGPLMNNIIVEDRSTALAYDFGYKDKHYARGTGTYINATDTTIPVDDATDIAALTMPTVIQVDSEQIQICSVTSNTLNICPGGHGYNGTTAGTHSPWRSWDTLIQVLSYAEPKFRAATSPLQKSLHPIFVLTQYTGFAGVKEEFILENQWITKTQLQDYDLTLKSGSSLGTTQYTKSGIVHQDNSRWRKTFWDGSAPGAINVNYNLPYMISTNAIPNFDQSKVVSSGAISSQNSAFAATDKGDIGGFAQWQPYFSAPGGRPDIGIYPMWVVQWLFTFDYGLYNVVLGNAQASGYVPIHFRETDSTRFFDSGHTVNAFAMPFSVDARPSASINTYGQTSNPADAPDVIGAQSQGGWAPDTAHQGDFAYIPYLVTGDWYWLEEMYFWADNNIGWAFPNDRGATGDWGFMNVNEFETRGQAWAMRSLAEAVFMAPDSDPEKVYITQKINYNIEIREGQYNIANGSFYDPTVGSKWYWGLNTINSGVTLNPLAFMTPPKTNQDTVDIDGTKECLQDSPWMYNYNHMVWGYMDDLGLTQIRPMRTYLAQNTLGQILDPGYVAAGANWLAAGYRVGVSQNPNGSVSGCPSGSPWAPYFTTWGGSLASQYPSVITSAATEWASRKTDPDGGYPNILRAATSYMSTFTGTYNGAAAWTWVLANANDPALNDNPKWALLPRGASTTPPPPPVTPPPTPGKTIAACDLNGDGQLTSADVAIAVQQVLNPASCSSADLNKDGVCNIVDVQLLINAVNAGSCPF